jgi:hypothetical protein
MSFTTDNLGKATGEHFFCPVGSGLGDVDVLPVFNNYCFWIKTLD